MLGRVVLVTCVCAGACAKLEERNNGGPVPQVVAVSADTSIVTGGGEAKFALEFSSTGVRLPISFKHNDMELLATNICPEPSLAGISLEPMTTAVAGRAVAAGLESQNTIRATWTGPAVAQVIVTYGVEYDCAGKQTLEGSSTFTIFPSGRVVRNDAVQPTKSAAAIDTSSCGGCRGPTGAGSRFDAFWTLRPDGDRWEIDPMNGERMLTPTQIGTASVSCALYSTHGIALGWAGDGTPSSDQLDNIDPMAFRYDFAKGTMIDSTVEVGLSHLIFAESGHTCAELEAKLIQPPFVIDHHGMQPLLPSAFGIYEYPNRVDYAEIRTQSGLAYQHGFALRLDIGEPEHLRIERKSGEQLTYVEQKDGAAYILWIQDGIAEGDSIIIEAF
jgi:hypothetical protein